ncbi:MAG TPA: TSUP family transporter [Flavisolibacter sp.]|jgi:hypothetical protein
MTIELYEIVLLCVAAFAAGFIDAIVGGGGLVQTPAALVILGAHPVSSVLASMKIPSFTGTAFAAAQYVKRVPIRWGLLGLLCTIAFFSAYAGSQVLLHVSNDFMKPVLLVVLTGVAIYTYTKKDFGQQRKGEGNRYELLFSILISAVVGFYDGFIGPGTGSFLILLFIALLGFDFLQASAHAKMVNLATNLGSITLFIIHGNIIWLVAIPMAVCNACGSILGSRMAIIKGNGFIRIFFLVIVVCTLLRFMYDVFYK